MSFLCIKYHTVYIYTKRSEAQEICTASSSRFDEAVKLSIVRFKTLRTHGKGCVWSTGEIGARRGGEQTTRVSYSAEKQGRRPRHASLSHHQIVMDLLC